SRFQVRSWAYTDRHVYTSTIEKLCKQALIKNHRREISAMTENDIADDLLDGMKAICRFLNIKERQGYELAETGRLPLFKLGDRKWQARKSTLRRHIESLESKGTAWGRAAS